MRNQGENPHHLGRVGAGIKTVYAEFTSRMDKTAIADLSIDRVKNEYALAASSSILNTPFSTILLMSIATCLLYTVLPVGDFPIPLAFGFLTREEMRNMRWAILSRVSSNSQFNNSSIETQIEEVEEECEKADGTVEYEYELAESGASIDRESLEDIVTKAENDEIDILGVSKFDRLMRANPWEGMDYLRQLKQAGVTLYVGTHGYFDYNDNFDFRILVQQIIFSRKWFERIRENAKDGQISELQKGKWPFGTPGYGYAKDDDNNIYLEDEKEAVLAAIFEEYEEERSIETVKENIEARFSLEELPSKPQIGTVLNNPLCVGNLMLKDRVVRRKPELAVVDPETFDSIREIRKANRPSSADAREIPEPVDRAAADFGPEYVIGMIDSLGTQCRKCGSDLRKYGTEERWETTVQKYKCKNGDCGYQGPLLTKTEFESLHATLPIRCPYCCATERFEVTREPDTEWDFTYECRSCEGTFGSNEVNGIYERAKENPHIQFDWYTDLRGVNTDDAESEEDQPVGDSGNNRELDEFSA